MYINPHVLPPLPEVAFFRSKVNTDGEGIKLYHGLSWIIFSYHVVTITYNQTKFNRCLSWFPCSMVTRSNNSFSSCAVDRATVKILKNWDTLNYYRDCPTNGIVGFYSAILRSKDADRITNRVDTDQTAP